MNINDLQKILFYGGILGIIYTLTRAIRLQDGVVIVTMILLGLVYLWVWPRFKKTIQQQEETALR